MTLLRTILGIRETDEWETQTQFSQNQSLVDYKSKCKSEWEKLWMIWPWFCSVRKGRIHKE